jgi:dihydropteroate synthase
MELHCRQRIISFPRRPLVMGIVNVNDDSFCGDGTLDISAAIQQAQRLVAAGADVIDAGAESARTNRDPISVAEEIARLEPFVTAFHAADWPAPADAAQVYPPLLSINTWRSDVAAALLPLGVDILNDLSALPDAVPAQLCLEHHTALLIMHSVGQPKVAHTHVGYDDIWATLEAFFTEKIALAMSVGLSKSQIMLDPGIDFAKQRDDNLRIYAGLQRLQGFGVLVLLPVSRKSVIGHVLGISSPTERDAGTVACIQMGQAHGAQIFRVHNVTAAYQSIKLLDWLDGQD